MAKRTESATETVSESVSQRDSRTTLDHVYVSVSDRVFDPDTIIYPTTSDSGCECDQRYEDAGAVYVGELTNKQYALFGKELGKLYKGQYVVGYWCEESYPPEKPAVKVLLNNYDFLTDDQKRALDIAVHIANNVRNAYGCGNRNIALRNKSARQQTTKPEKPKDKSPQTRNRSSKYEELVRVYLEHLVAAVLEGKKDQKEMAELTAMDVAKAIKGAFKAKITSVEERVRKTEAWKNRDKTFAPIYNTKTFRERKNTKSPYQRVQ